MKEAERKKRYTRYNEALLSKIDNMPSSKDTDPYKATKKESVTDAELYDDDLYEDLRDKPDTGKNAAMFAIIIIAGLAAIGIIAMLTLF